MRDLGPANGLGVEIPEDASLVVVAGPEQPFLPEELGALQRYLAKGGHVFLALDPEARIDLAPLADLAGVRVSSSLLANDHVHLRRRYNDSDHGILVTNGYSSHASISTLSRMASRPIFLVGSGSLQQKQGLDSSFHVTIAVHALADTFNDENGNFLFDPPAEKKQMYGIAAAVTRRVPGKANDEMRAFVISDADVVSDVVLGNEANVILAADAVRWLGGEESFAGSVTTAEDVRIEHTKQKDLVWFYGSIFAAPALVLGFGLTYTSRLRRSKKGGARRKPPTRAVRDGGVTA